MEKNSGRTVHQWILLTFLSILFLQIQVFAQTGNEITGKITDKDGEPLIGVSIVVKGTSAGTITDVDGRFKIEADRNDVLAVSYIGYATQTIQLLNATLPLNIVMTEDSQKIDEVVVTALGIKRSEKALSYNVQKVDNEMLTSVKDANFVEEVEEE